MVKEVAPTESAVIGVSRIGQSKISDGNLHIMLKADLDLLNGGRRSNIIDALIAEIAIKNGFTLLTADYHLQDVAKQNGCKVSYWSTN